MKLWKSFYRSSNVFDSGERIEFEDINSSQSPTFSEDSGQQSQASSSSAARSALLTIQLFKKSHESFGIELTRASDIGGCPTVASLRTDSASFLCDQLMVGDKLHSVNGINTARLSTDQINTLLNTGDEEATIQVEYSLPDYVSQNSLCVMTKVTNVIVERINGSLGITLRGGSHDDPQYNKPLIITNVRPHGPAHRTGLIKVGDRLLKVDHCSLTNKSLLEAQHILTKQNDGNQQTSAALTTLTIEYDLSIIESVKYATGPLLVEIERHLNENLGIILSSNCLSSEKDTPTGGVYIENIVPASIADRCGALHVGDQILAVDDMYIENTFISPGEVMCMLQSSGNNHGLTRLQILPYHTFNEPHHRSPSSIWNHARAQVPSGVGMSAFNSLNSRKTCQSNGRLIRQKISQKSNENEGQHNYCSYNPQLGVCHVETLNVTLCAEGEGYGLSIGTEQSIASQQVNIIITDIETNSVADRCGCLQVGDRLLTINNQTNLTFQEVNSILERGYSSDISNSIIDLLVAFDVADTVVPSSGIFTVKLSRHNRGLGITITASKNNLEEPFIISDIKCGSIAHRIGTLQAGDRLLAIDNQNLTHTTLEAAFDILQNSADDIVTLRIEKVEQVREEPSPYFYSDSVVYTVELVRYGGPLGITISGSEDCIEPIVLSKLIEGGLAEKTGALHVGDRILAINGENLINKPLSAAIRLLQSSGDRVQLKISRSVKNSETTPDDTRQNYPSPGLQSIDSAVESWTGSTFLDISQKNDGAEPQVRENVSITAVDQISLDSDQPNYSKSTVEILDDSNKMEDIPKSDPNFNLQYYSDTDDVFCPSPLPLPNYTFTNSLQNKFDQFAFNIGQPSSQKAMPRKPVNRTANGAAAASQYEKHEDFEYERLPIASPCKSPNSRQYFEGNFGSTGSRFDISNFDIYHVVLYKDAVYDDYGFSVSDGLYEKGVFVNRIRKGGPADIVGLLRPYDRILQVNDTKTQDFDCCLTVPLIASAGDRIELIIARNPSIDAKRLQVLSWITEKQENMSTTCTQYPITDDSTITKTI